MKVDYVVAGGGLAGTLLAWRLAHHPALRDKRIVVIEKQPQIYERIISFWLPPDQLGVLPGRDVVLNTWDEICMRTRDYERYEQLVGYQFGALDYGEYIGRLRTDLERCPNVSLLFEEVRTLGRHTVTTTTRDIEAEYVFDSTSVLRRSVGPYMPAVTLRVNMPHADTMTFFDTRIDGLGYPAFAYVLPVSPGHAILQLAAVTPAPQDLNREQLERAAQRYVGSYISRGRAEMSSYGIIPLKITYPTRGEVPIPIGLNAELVKPTTGYGFTRFVQQADEIASRLASGKLYTIRSSVKSNVFRMSDEALLRRIGRDPKLLEVFFGAIIRYATPSQLLSWLDEAPSVGAIMRLSVAFCATSIRHR